MIVVRPVRADDAERLGRICHDAFASISDEHNFPRDFPNPAIPTGLLASLIANPGFHGVVAEDGGRLLGSNFLDERGPVFGLGPITVDPAAQNEGVGRRLMEAALKRTQDRGAPGVRLLQAGYHRRSLSLYAKLGFGVREPLACMTGPAIGARIEGCAGRPATADDLAPCASLCRRIHGHDRLGELEQAVQAGTARVVERGGRITGYASQIGYFGHAVGLTADDVKALIVASGEVAPPGVLIPTRSADLFAWCLDQGLRVTQPMTLMTLGLYNEPMGAWLPSILY
jgi:GNAT superfamily N-acetyltransferase